MEHAPQDRATNSSNVLNGDRLAGQPEDRLAVADRQAVGYRAGY